MTRKPLGAYQFSLRARATTWYVGLLAVALTVFSIGVYFGVRTYLKVSLQRSLSSSAHAISDDFLTKLPAKGDAWVLGEIRESYEASPTDRYIRLSVGSTVLYQTGDMRDPAISVNKIPLPPELASEAAAKPPLIGDLMLPRITTNGIFYRHFVDGRGVMIYSLPFLAADGRVFEIEAGTSLYSMQGTMRSLMKILTISTIPILVLAAIGGYLLMKQPLRPLVVLTDKAANIGRKTLGERLPVIHTGDELERLTHSLNGMIDRLEEALNHNHRFSADASHELRTPLTIMRGELEEMLRIDDLPAQAVGNLVSTLDEIDRMSRIVNSLMTITRLDAGGERMDMQVLDFAALVRTTVDHMKLLAEEKGLPLTCSWGAEVFIFADPMRIKQVLVNLIDNAIKYTPPSEIPPESLESPSMEPVGGRIDVAVFATESSAVLKIADQGVGISPEALPKVFDRFYRADLSRSRGAGGVGLGLAIVKAIITAHDGSVSITSVPGQGTTMVVELPLAQPPTTTFADEPAPMRKQPRYQTI
jgi:signal transduction histidine kinase